MKRISLWALAFALLSLVFFILLIFLRIPFPLYPLMSYQDGFDLLTPLVLIPIYWLLFKYATSQPPGLIENIAFLGLSVLWVEGHGMHLAANSISNLFPLFPISRARALRIKARLPVMRARLKATSRAQLKRWLPKIWGRFKTSPLTTVPARGAMRWSI